VSTQDSSSRIVGGPGSDAAHSPQRREAAFFKLVHQLFGWE
jgi:hypothetical protein